MQRRHCVAATPQSYLVHVATHEVLLDGVSHQSLHHLQLFQRRGARSPDVLHPLQRVGQREQLLRLVKHRRAVRLQQRVLQDAWRKHFVDDGTGEEATQVLRMRSASESDHFYVRTVELQIADSFKGLFEPLFESEGRESNAVADSEEAGNELALLVVPVQRQRDGSHHRLVSKQRSVKLLYQTRGQNASLAH